MQVVEETLEHLLDKGPRITWATRDRLQAPQPGDQTLVIDAEGFPPEDKFSGPPARPRTGCTGTVDPSSA